MRALVLADGTSSSRAGLEAAWPGWDREIAIVVAADGGARLAGELGLRMDAWVGDGDSLRVADRGTLVADGVPMLLASPEKNESDTELALLEAVRRGATDVTILGGLGGVRHDHALANVTLLAHAALAGRSARLLDASARVSLLVGGTNRDATDLRGRVGDLVTLLPLGGDVEGVTVTGLRYPLEGDRLIAGATRGLSNVRCAATCTIGIESGWLLVIESPATLRS